MGIQRVVSSGGVIYRNAEDGELQVALISNDRRWLLPKGFVEQGETAEEAALREVKEETGLQGEIVGKLGDIDYSFSRGTRFFKTVHFYLMKFIGGSMTEHDSEVDTVRWVPISEAARILAYPNERRIVQTAETMLRQKPGEDEKKQSSSKP